jgi:dihydroorotase/N-acyl-D-amino-acid deacylase
VSLKPLSVALAAGLICATCSPASSPESASVAAQAAPAYDVIISNGRVVDGTGAPWFRADVGIAGDRITAVGDLRGAPANGRIDASGLVVAPGFIDLLGQSEFNVLVDNRAASKILQGVTTEITGEGQSIAPVNDRIIEEGRAPYDHFQIAHDWHTLAEYFARFTRTRSAINLGTFVGSGTLRRYVVGTTDRAASPAELDAMRTLVANAMEEGALGVSSSLQYVPNRFASTDELVELARVAARYGGIYITHQRSEANRIDESLDEVFAIAERAAIPAEIWHLKTAYRKNWGRMPAILAKIEAARARGLQVSANVYPYNRASNGLDASLPVWAREGGTDAMIARLRNPADRARIKKEMDDPDTEYENQWYGSGGATGVMLAAVLNPELRKFEGMTLAEIGRAMGKDPRDALMDIVIADRGESDCILAMIDDNDVRTAVKHPLISFGSDSQARAEDGPLSESTSHPRGWGTFPRILARYVRDEHLLTLEEAIRKMTSQAAIRVGIVDRGLLRPGMFADVVIFDPAKVKDEATFEAPNRYSTGIRDLFVNGRAVVRAGRITDERPGRPIRGAGYARKPNGS